MRRSAVALAASISLGASEPEIIHVIEYQTVIVERAPSWEEALAVETPLIDAMISDEQWAEIDRQSDCLFEYLREHVGLEITLERVLAAGAWTDALGGACLVIGVDSE